jgi:hypothetical protein
MTIDNIIPLAIRKISAPNFLTFNCAPGAADLTSIEGCVPNDFYNSHTYDLAIRLAPPITGIAGTVTAGPWITEDDCKIQIKDVNEETWHELLTFRTKKNNVYQFECYPPYPSQVGMFRIWFDSPGQIIESKGRLQVGETPLNQQPTKTQCETAGGYWYNGSCHLIPPLCDVLNNESDCNTYGCYWANGKCNPYPTSCEGWLTETDCVNHGCSWWNTSNPYLPNTCHDPTMTAKRLALEPEIPADMHSTTPPGSTYAEFIFPEKIKVFRGFGTVRIGGGYITTICFWLDNYGDMWKNRVKVQSGYTKTFDEDYKISDERTRMGTTFRVGVKGTDIPIEHLNMVLVYRPATEVMLLDMLSYVTPVIPGTDVPINFRLINASSSVQRFFWELKVNNEIKDYGENNIAAKIATRITANTGPLTTTSKFTITYGHYQSYTPPYGEKITDGITSEHTIEVR